MLDAAPRPRAGQGGYRATREPSEILRDGALTRIGSGVPGTGGPGGYRARDRQIAARESSGNGAPKQPEHVEKHLHPSGPGGRPRFSNHLLIKQLHQWALPDSNQRPPACKAGALTKLS